MKTAGATMIHFALYLISFILLAFPATVSAWSFNISSRVVQCANLSVTWDGGVAPWNVVLIPVGALQSGPEIRTIVDANVTEGNSFSFQLKFPAGSQFLAIMSDATGVGTGGTSVLISVLDGDSSCLATSATKPQFYFYLDPATGQPNQCGTWGVSWDAGNTQGPVRMAALIPGGQSFSLPVPGSGNAFDWTVDMRQGTQFLLVAGDARGFGTGGSTDLYTVQGGSSSCIDAASPSSTAAPAAGGIYATGSGAGSVTGAPFDGPQSTQGASNSGSGSSSNIGAIVGGAIGGVAGLIALLLVGLFFWRRHRLHQQRAGTQGRKSVDLLHEDSEFGAGGAAALAGAGAGVAGASAAGDHISDGRPMSQTDTAGRLSFSSHAPTDATGTPIFTQFSRRGSAPSLPPLAFGGAGTISDTGHGDVKSSAQGPAHMRNSSGPFPPSSFNPPAAARPETPTTTDGTSLRTPMTAAQRASEKMGLPPPGTLRPVNIVQHEDAGVLASGGPSTTQNDEILELPPSYQDVRRNSGTQEGL
ncbi:hypothetical protein FRC04_009656 [Tulasnella sp. 424]|nr:hypothetical protein FRC04_009656 [Tulasnella sp. 424]KAG8975954.1 hypothetical protein FRC05_004885 [Tulasnella sp. 425]